jgi:hypothetical protein
VFAVEPSEDQDHFDGNFDLIGNWSALPVPDSNVYSVIKSIREEQSTLF